MKILGIYLILGLILLTGYLTFMSVVDLTVKIDQLNTQYASGGRHVE